MAAQWQATRPGKPGAPAPPCHVRTCGGPQGREQGSMQRGVGGCGLFHHTEGVRVPGGVGRERDAEAAPPHVLLLDVAPIQQRAGAAERGTGDQDGGRVCPGAPIGQSTSADGSKARNLRGCGFSPYPTSLPAPASAAFPVSPPFGPGGGGGGGDPGGSCKLWPLCFVMASAVPRAGLPSSDAVCSGSVGDCSGLDCSDAWPPAPLPTTSDPVHPFGPCSGAPRSLNACDL